MTPLVDEGASTKESLARIVDSMGEQIEQMSIRMSELLERAVYVEKEILREEINRNSTWQIVYRERQDRLKK